MTPLFAYLTLETSWRLFVILCAVPCIISGFLGACLVPESPRWLMSVGQPDKALAVIRNAARVNGLNPDIAFGKDVKLKEEDVEESGFRDLLSSKWRRITLLLWFTWAGYAIGYYGTILTVTRVFDADAVEGADEPGGTPNFDYQAIFISASAEIIGLFTVINTIDSIGRIPSQVMAYIGGGTFLFLLSMFAGTANNTTLTVLAFFARAFEMMGSCVTWVRSSLEHWSPVQMMFMPDLTRLTRHPHLLIQVSTAEILTTDIRTTGHSAANAMVSCISYDVLYRTNFSQTHIISA